MKCLAAYGVQQGRLGLDRDGQAGVARYEAAKTVVIHKSRDGECWTRREGRAVLGVGVRCWRPEERLASFRVDMPNQHKRRWRWRLGVALVSFG